MNRLCLVTNATARSISWYILAYLKEQNLSDERIIEIKEKLNFSNLDNSEFNVDELVKSFIEKNIYFLKLFDYLKSDNRYYNFLNNLKTHNRVSTYFRTISDIDKIYDDFNNRNVFHSSIFCKWIKNDYVDENIIVPNTDVFAKHIINTQSSYYKLDENYLKELKLRECKVCKNIVEKGFNHMIDILQMMFLIANAKNISVSFDILNNNLIFGAISLKAKQIKVEIYLTEEDWKKADINLLLENNFIVRLIHNNFSFFNSESMILINDEIYFHSSSHFYIPNSKYIDTTVFHILKFNTILLSKNEEINSTFSYKVPVKHIHSSHDEIFGEQSIVELESFGITGFLTLKCHFSQVPNSIFGYWQSKAEVLSSSQESKTLDHNYFSFKCTDPDILKAIV